MKHGLGDAIVESALELEKYFHEHFADIFEKHKEEGKKQEGKKRSRRRHKLTLGDKAFEGKLRERLPGKTKLLFDWFKETRNAILHHGDSPQAVERHQKIRNITTLNDINQAKTALLMLLELGKETKEDDSQRACKAALTARVFEEVFGKTIKSPAKSDIQNPIELPQQKNEAQVAAAPSNLDQANVLNLFADKSKTKINALDLFADDKQPKVNTATRTGKAVLGMISKLLDGEEESENKTLAPAAAPTAPADETTSDDPKLIVIKEPILIPEIAARLGLKPFNIMANLIKIGAFPAPNQPLKPEIAAKICEIHGFVFEREKPIEDIIASTAHEENSGNVSEISDEAETGQASSAVG